jgi:hypothetical protein
LAPLLHDLVAAIFSIMFTFSLFFLNVRSLQIHSQNPPEECWT